MVDVGRKPQPATVQQPQVYLPQSSAKPLARSSAMTCGEQSLSCQYYDRNREVQGRWSHRLFTAITG